MKQARYSLVVLAIGMAACGTATVPGDPEPLYRIEAVRGLNQLGEPGYAVPEAPAVRIRRDGVPIAGERVTFQVIDGGGLGDIGIVTDAEGIARMPIWVLGPSAGSHRLLVLLANEPSTTFEFVAEARWPVAETARFISYWPDTLRYEEVRAQYEPTTFARHSAARVRVSSRSGAPVRNHLVRWAVTRGTAQIMGADTRTDSLGIAALVVLRLPTVAGDQVEVEATVDGIAPPNRHTWRYEIVAGEPYELRVLAGANQVGVSGTPTPVRPRFMLLDAFGNALQPASLSFIVREGGGRIAGADSAAVISWQSAEIEAPEWVLGPPGPQILRVQDWANGMTLDIHATATVP